VPAAPAAGAAPAKTQPEDSTSLPPVEVIQQQPPAAPPPEVITKKPGGTPVNQATAKPQPTTPQPAAQQAAGNGVAPQPVAPTLVEPTAIPAYAAPALSAAIKTSPLAGSEIALEKVPGAVGRASAADFARQPTPTPQAVLQSQVPGVILTDLQGNEFQTQLDYRGFSSSPLQGVAQGLAVYQNGVRINEAFGDIVNFDFLPSNAIFDITVISGNPVFGLNAIGGAAVFTMRDGFTFQGTEIDTRFGSFGRLQGALATGQQSGNWAAFVALEGINDDGWRDFSPSEIKRAYADVGVKGDRAEFHLNFTIADNKVGAVTASPVELLALGWDRTFTSPQNTDNQVAMVSFNGSVKATDTLTFSGLTYFRRFKQRRIDGNLAEFAPCSADPSILCAEEDGVEEPLESGGSEINPGLLGLSEPFGVLDHTRQDADSYGFALQAVEKRRLFDRPNQFLLGLSYDHGKVDYGAASEFGTIGPRFVVTGSGLIIDEPEDFLPRDVTSKNNYWGLYFLNTLDLTDRLSVTLGGRYNNAGITLQDNTGDFPEIDSKHSFERFNPTAGATFKLFPGISLYGGYSEANRAPTPAELACSDPDNPCLIESFLTDDPPLQQVVSKTWELGVRGEASSPSGLEKVQWSFGYFNTLNIDDILAISAPQAGRGYFANAGNTQRQGIEIGLNYSSPRLKAYANYSYVDATFRDTNILPSPFTPARGPDVVDCEDPTMPYDDTDPDQVSCLVVRPGDQLPGIPPHRFKAGFNYAFTPRWKFGADLVAASSQVFFGDEANLTSRLPGWWRVNLNSTYDVTEHIQIYGLINNVFDKHYGVFGNFFDTEAGTEASVEGITFNNPRTIVPAAPVAAYGGIRIKF